MPENDDQWLWVADDDEPAASNAELEVSPAESRKSTVLPPEVVGAVRMHLAGKTQEAVDALNRAAVAGRDLAEVYAALGQIHFEAGRPVPAAEAFCRLAAAEPHHRAACYNQGVCLERAGRIEEAMNCFTASIDKDPDTRAYLGLAVCHLRLGKHGEALRLFERVLAADGGNSIALGGRAAALRQSGRLPEAAEAYRKVLALQPHSREALQGLAAVSFALAEYSQAADACAHLVRSEPSSFIAQYNLGVAMHKLGRLDEAVQAYAEATRIDARSARAWLNLGVVMQMKGSAEAARRAYEHALDADPDLVAALWNLGIEAEQAGEYEEAAMVYAEVTSKRKDSCDAWFRLGYNQLRCKDLAAAATSFQECLRLEPDSTAALRGLAALSLELQDLDQARLYQAKLNALGERSSELAFNLAVALGGAGRHEDAVQLYHEALNAKPRFPEAQLNLGHALQALGRVEEAHAA